MWFARLISAQRNRSKHVNESTFYSMVQYIAIVLFECCDNDDFSPANILMNMCFIFYYESKKNYNLLAYRFVVNNNIVFPVEVPGCEPYREYLYTYLRDQPIWQSLRFWSAAFDDSLQARRQHRCDTTPIGTPTRLAKLAGTSQQSPKHYNAMALNPTIDKEQLSDRLMSSDAEDTEDRHFCFGQLGYFI